MRFLLLIIPLLLLASVARAQESSMATFTLTVGHTATDTWQASTSSDVTGYNVYRGVQSGGPYMLLTDTPVAGLSFVDITVAAGATYFYVVTALAGAQESAFSNELSATIPSP